jgi:DNA adenine methylase
MNNISPLRYPGGKTRACKCLDEIVNKYFDIKSYTHVVSPFFGGGSFEFYLQNKYKLNIIANDKFTPLYNYWITCKYNNATLVDILTTFINKIDKDIFTSMRNAILIEHDIIQQSVMYFILNRCSFSGSTLSGGFSLEASKKRFTLSSINRIKQLNLTQFTIYNSDFKEFIDTQLSDKYLLFLDPPYYLEKGSKLYGNKGDLHDNFDHNKLYACLNNKKNWIMTYNNCDYIKNLYKNFIIIETSWSYGMNKSKKSSEIVIISK